MSLSISGRGSIAQVQYSGEEAYADIKSALEAVVANEDDFDPWQALVEKACGLEGGVTRNSNPSAIELVRNVLDCLLAKWPLFFGYWKRYADLEFNIGGTETAEMVYERATACFPNSVDLWAGYCGFKMDTSHDPDVIRELFERGAELVGRDFQSYPFWDKYIEFEERNNEPAKITRILARAFQLPSYAMGRYFEKFRNLIGYRPVEELVDATILQTLNQEVESENEGIMRSPLEIERQLRGKIDTHYYTIFNRVSAEASARWGFENAIKRPYFHVTEVEEADLDNWRQYLTYEETHGDYTSTRFLYERCIVSCAMYDEFWLRYARWLFSQGKEEDARIVYMRASCIFVPISRTLVRINWAIFEEKLGRVEVARDILSGILEVLPDDVESLISLAGIERRHSGNDAAVEALETFIGGCSSQVGGYLAAEQARILWRCKGAADEARQVYQDKHPNFLDSKAFWQFYLDFEMQQPAPDQEEAHKRIQSVFQLLRRVGQVTSEESKELSQQYMQYLKDYGGKKAAEEYMMLDKEVNGRRHWNNPINDFNRGQAGNQQHQGVQGNNHGAQQGADHETGRQGDQDEDVIMSH